MDVVEDSRHAALSAQGHLLGEQQCLDEMDACITHCYIAGAPSTPCADSMFILHPEKLLGEVSVCKGFLQPCCLFFMSQMGTFNQQKIAQFINLLTGKCSSRQLLCGRRVTS